MTPNSFSDGGAFVHLDAACHRAQQMVDEGADIIDIGGEATNPGATPISEDEELSRVIPVIQAIRERSDIPLSIDTSKAAVMVEAVRAGVSFINDITALQGVNALSEASDLNVPICLMHMNGTPLTMQDTVDEHADIMADVHQFFAERIAACVAKGIPRQHLVLDPGIGFGKTTQQNLTILRHLAEFHRYALPLLLGVSRKRLIGDVLQQPVGERLMGGVALAVYAVTEGVTLIRTHDVMETKQALCMLHPIMSAA